MSGLIGLARTQALQAPKVICLQLTSLPHCPHKTQVELLEQFVNNSFWRNQVWARVPTILRWTPL
jgi:hypothetical protein